MKILCVSLLPASSVQTRVAVLLPLKAVVEIGATITPLAPTGERLHTHEGESIVHYILENEDGFPEASRRPNPPAFLPSYDARMVVLSPTGT